MSRPISAGGLIEIAKRTGIEPILVVDIEWVPGTFTRYADKPINGSSGLILAASSIDEVVSLDSGNTRANIELTLDDTDGIIRGLMDQYDIHKRTVIVRQYFDGLDITDAFEVFRGQIHSPIVWSEGTREVSFSVYSMVFTTEAGFSPEEGQFPEIPEDLIGLTWPMCFGTPIHVPAAKAKQTLSASAMSSGGIPDATLPLKKEILEYRLNQINQAYTYYLQLIEIASGIEVPAKQLQEEYAQHIIGRDLLKQTFEDISTEYELVQRQIAELIQEYTDLEGEDRTTLVENIQTLRGKRDSRATVLTGLRNQLDLFEKTDDVFGIRLENLKFEINLVSRLRKHCGKLKQDYANFARELVTVNQAISSQNTNMGSSIYTSGGYRFPQQVSTSVVINNTLISGIFIDNLFTIGAAQASYNGINVTARLTEQPDMLWLDTTVNLNGMYLFSDKGYICKVVRQEGNKVQIQLPKKNRSPRTKTRNVDYADEDNSRVKDIFDDTLSRLLSGGESQEQIAQIANTIPKQINPAIYKQLTGSSTTTKFRITVVRVNGGLTSGNSSFRLKYGELYVTVPIFYTDSGFSIQQKILGCTDLLPSGAVNVTIVKKDAEDRSEIIEVEIADVIPYKFSLFDVNTFVVGQAKKPNMVTLQYVPQSDGMTCTLRLDRGGLSKTKLSDLFLNGKIDFYLQGKVFTQTGDAGTGLSDDEFGNLTGEAIVARFVADGLAEVGEIVGEGGWPGDDGEWEDITLRYTQKNKSIFVDASKTVFTLFDPDIDNDSRRKSISKDDLTNGKVLGEPKIIVTYDGYASEYTKNEIGLKLQEAADENNVTPGLAKFKEKFAELLKERQELKKNGEIDYGVEQALAQVSQQISSILSKVNKVGAYDIFDIVSDREQELLYGMEVSGYLQFINQVYELDTTFTEDEAYEFTAKDFGASVEAAPIIIPRWLQSVHNTTNIQRRMQLIEALPRSTEGFYIGVGESIVSALGYEEKYIANILPSTIRSVYAYRNIGGIKRFVPVPSSYYAINEDDDYGWYSCTSITLAKPLKWFDDSWADDDIYTTLTSSIGPNVVDVITWIAETYTNLVVDSTSFAHVHALQENYPVNFAKLEKQNALALIEDIAWQARCVCWVARGTLYIRYLPEKFEPVKTITEDDIAQSSLKLTFTETEQLITKYTALWRETYIQKELYRTIVRRNVKKYEEITEDREIYIYNERSLVEKSLTFWAIRRGTTWRKALFTLYLNHLDLETQDIIGLDISYNYITDGPINAIVEQAVYDSEQNTIGVTCWLPVQAHEKTEYKFFWPKDLTITDVFPLPEEIISGNAGNPINIQVPSGEDYDPYDETLLSQRPKDFGSIKPGDGGDAFPKSVAEELTQLDYDLDNMVKSALSDDTNVDETTIFTNPAEGYFPTLVSPDQNKFPDKDFTSMGTVLEEFKKDHSAEFLPETYSKNLPVYYARILLSSGRKVIAYAFDTTVRVKPGEKVLVFTVNKGVVDIQYVEDEDGEEVAKKLYLPGLTYIKPTNAPAMDVDE